VSVTPPRPEVPAESVRPPVDGLLVGSLCPVCGRVELRGRQTVCSAACRRERSRRQEEDRILAHVEAIARLIEARRRTYGRRRHTRG